MKRYKMNFDGACSGNPGPMGCGVFIVNVDDETEKYTISAYAGEGTNNTAEYKALIKGLVFLTESLKPMDCEIEIYGDSQFVIKQINNEWAVKEPRLYPLYKRAQELINKLTLNKNHISLKHVPREQNKAADNLSKSALAAAKE